jgi:hypothetical protein
MDAFRDLRILPLKWLRIDVDLCGHLLVMHRREEHLKCMHACLEVSVCVHEFLRMPAHDDVERSSMYLHTWQRLTRLS